VPEIEGAPMLEGSRWSTAVVAPLAALAEPPALVAVTRTRIVEPMSAPVST
jgi:hypothetical protein